MKHFKSKNFFTPIVALIIFTIFTIATFSAYVNITTFEQHINNDILKMQNNYLQQHKQAIKQKVITILKTISFEISKLEESAKEKLNERLETATKLLHFIYSQKKDQLNNQQILKLVAKHFSTLTYGKDGYFFIYDYNTHILKYHIQKNLIGKDMSNFRDKKGTNVLKLYDKILKNKKIAYAKIYFSKPSDPNHQYPKLVAITKFEPLHIVVGTGIYMDEIKTKAQKRILEQFNDVNMKKNGYTFFMKLHNINGGPKFATMILNPNRPDLIGKTLNDNVKDSNGNYYRKKYLKVLRENKSGFVKYYYKKPYIDIQKPKMSYFALQQDWQWIIASGFYYDDLETEAQQMKHNLYLHSHNIIMKTIKWAIGFSLFVLIIAIFLASKINNTIQHYIYEIEKLNYKLYGKTKQLKNSINIITEHVVISKTDLKGKITEVSDAFCELSGYSREELIGKPHNIVRHPDMPQSAFRDLWQTIQNNQTWKGEVKNLRKDGSFYWFIANISPNYDIDGKKIGYMAIRTDITAKKQYEKEHDRLIQAEKLASMGELIGNIAHQWRQPLSVISTCASSIDLKHELGTLEDDDIPKNCNIINHNVQYLSKTIESFKEFVREDKVKVIFKVKNDVDNFLHIMQGSIKLNDIQVILNLDDTLEIMGYEHTLIQCFINIFDNAKDAFMANKIKHRLFFISSYKKDDKVYIILKDNAGGIPKDILTKIFEPYFTTKHQSQGTGLGLHTAYNIITNKMNGTIEADNEIYKYNDKEYIGAKFTIIL